MDGKRQLSRSLENISVEKSKDDKLSDDDIAITPKQLSKESCPVTTFEILTRSLPRQPSSTANLRPVLTRSQTIILEEKEEDDPHSQSYAGMGSGFQTELEHSYDVLGGGGGQGQETSSRGVAECTLCLEEFHDTGDRIPRNLTCGHTFCTGCIRKLLYYPKHNQPKISCPKCKSLTAVPDRAAENLSKNFGLLEVISTSPSPHQLIPTELATREVPMQRKSHFCAIHGDHISSYCTQDDTLVCSSCLLYGEHKGHKSLFLSNAAEIKRKVLKNLYPEVFTQRKKMETALSEVEDRLKEVKEEGGRLEESIDAKFSLLLSAIDERRKELKVEVMHRTQARVEVLMDQATDLRANIAKASFAYSRAAGLMGSSDLTFLEGSTLAMDLVEAVFTNPPALLPRAAADLTGHFSEDVEKEIVSQIEGYGCVKSMVGTIENLYCDEYHDGIRVFWDRHSLTDNEGISYHLQLRVGGLEFANLYRGGNTKYTWKSKLERDTSYQFRVQVRTTEGIGPWSQPVTTMRADPVFRWHPVWRHVRIELSNDNMEVSCYKAGSGNSWATFAGACIIDSGQLYYEIEILDLGRPRAGKRKLAVGVIGCKKSKVNSLPWHDSKSCVGDWKDHMSWAFHPTVCTRNCNSFTGNGKPYGNIPADVEDRIGVLLNAEEGTIYYFYNGQDLGLAFDNVRAEVLLPAVSIQGRVRVRLCFPPPPFSKRDPKIIRFSSFGSQHRK